MQGEELRALRAQTGMTIGKFAEEIGVNVSTLGRMERNVEGYPIERRTELAARYVAERDWVGHYADLPGTWPDQIKAMIGNIRAQYPDEGDVIGFRVLPSGDVMAIKARNDGPASDDMKADIRAAIEAHR